MSAEPSVWCTYCPSRGITQTSLSGVTFPEEGRLPEVKALTQVCSLGQWWT